MAADHSRVPKILRLWLLYARLDVLWIARSWGTALSWIIADLIVGLGVVVGTYLIAERFDGIGAWSKFEVIFMLGYALVLNGIVDVFFGWNVAAISRRIGRGQLDHMLLQPQGLPTTLLTEGFSPVSGAGRGAVGFIVIATAGSRLGIEVTTGWLALFALNLAGSTAVFMAFAYGWGSLAFWAPRAAEEINSSTERLLNELRGFPLDGLGTGLVATLLTLVPAGFVAWLPSRALVGIDPSALSAWLTPLASLAFAALAAALFQQGLRHYGHTGSSRYLSLGHRR